MAVEGFQYERPPLYPKQEAAIFDPARISVIEAGTKSGKTVGCMAWIFEKAWLGKKGQNFWWVAPYYAQARIAYERMKNGLPPQVFKSNDNDMILKLPNGTRIWFKSGDKPDTLYGEDVFACVIDEASRLREESWWAVRSTVTATKAPVRVIGNVKGKLNWAWKLGRRAKDWVERWVKGGKEGPKLYGYHVITCWDAVEAGVLDRQEIEEAREDLPPKVFEELYEAQATETGSNPFGAEAIEACILDYTPTGIPVVWGWDLARKRDWTVGIGLDEFGQVVRFERFKQSWPTTIEIIQNCTETNPAIVDSTGVGDAILGQLQRDQMVHNQYDGYVFTQRSKQQLMEGLAVAIQNQEVTFVNGVLVEELRSFEYEHTRTGVLYAAPEGMHDDCVCALALARQALVTAKVPEADVW
jgi:hypothetical protein